MSTQYEEIRAPRFVVETVDGHEQIAIAAQRNIFIMLFLLLWLGGWTVGGVAAIGALSSKGFQPFLVFWLGGWAAGEALVAATLCWLFSGVEVLRVLGTDLEVSYQMLGFAKRRLFRGSEIRNLSSCDMPAFGRYNQMPLPFLGGNKMGSVKFSYGARTIYLAAGLDEAEGQLIVDRLRERLPSTAAA
jgi:hypothetical protein